MSDERKSIKIVNGDGSNLEISHVYDHINASKPNHNEKKPKHIIVPETHKNNIKK